jgi:murein DD-endopeptidase MepM/ murein hydrolase activator NlpD
VEEICPPGESCIVEGSFWLARPVSVEYREETDPSYRFSMIRRGVGPHLGADFLNSTGTPVSAAADGTVAVAGDDRKKAYSNKVNEYGSLVILQHNLPGVNLPVFTLYAHLSEVLVQEGQTVKTGDLIGKVGSSGGVRGSTLHFEVRLGENTYRHVRNPELWLTPMPADDGQPTGAIAGRIVNERGKPVTVNNIVIEQLEGSGQGVLDTWYVRQYREPRNSGQEPWLETFALGSLPPGLYQISFFYQGMQQRVLEVKPGQLTLTTFQFESEN